MQGACITALALVVAAGSRGSAHGLGSGSACLLARSGPARRRADPRKRPPAADSRFMPHNKTTRPFADLSDADRVAAIFTFEAVYDIHPSVLSPVVPVGRRFLYPPLLQFMVAMTARVFGSQRSALIALSKPGVWEQCCGWYCERVGHPISLPATPPTPAEQDRFVERLIQEGTIGSLSEELTEVPIGQAVHQGQFPHDTVPDFANPDRRHVVFGDGTWQKPYSQVVEHRDADGMVIGHTGSRAVTRAPRVQRVRRNGPIDDKIVDGINNVALGTWTDAGRIILSSRATVESEGKVAIDMIDQLATRLGKRLHTVTYDGAFSGWWQVGDLLARHRLQVLTKPKARASTVRQSDGYTPRVIKEADALDRHTTGKPLPLGTTVYFTRDSLKVVNSTFYRLTKVAKEVATCAHDHQLWVDAGLLVDVMWDEDTHRLVKHATATAVRAVPQPQGNLQDFELPTDWKLKCPFAKDGFHRFTTVWRPSRGKTERPAKGEQRALRDLRPVGVHDERFWSIYGVRNNAESHNQLYKDTFQHDGKAMRLDAEAQFLDQLAFAATVNAITAWTFRRQQGLLNAQVMNSGGTVIH
jgi:hypothetical protein